MNETVVVVTGASSGFGAQISSLLSSRGYRVYGTSRAAPAAAQEARGGESREGGNHRPTLRMVRLDVTSDSSVRSFVDHVVGEAGSIDALINNAGYVLTGAAEETSLEEAKAQFETNFFGAVRLTNSVLPLMRRQRRGRIINIGSLVSTISVPFEPFYAATKAALAAYSESLRYELLRLNIQVSLVEPGFFRTGLSQSGRRAASRIPDYSGFEDRALDVLAKDFRKGQDPMLVARTVAGILEKEYPKFRYTVGRERRYVVLRRLMPESSFERGVRRHWKLDEEDGGRGLGQGMNS